MGKKYHNKKEEKFSAKYNKKRLANMKKQKKISVQENVKML